MSYLTDPDFDKKMNGLTDFLKEQQEKLLALIDEGPEDNSIEAVFGNEINK